MYDLSRLWKSAGPGLRDLLRTPFALAKNRHRETVNWELWRPAPRLGLWLLAIASVVVGAGLHQADLKLPFSGRARWTLLLFAGATAWFLRRALTAEGSPLRKLGSAASHDLFRAVAWPVVLPSVLLVVLDVVTQLTGWSQPFAAPGGTGVVAAFGWAAISVETALAYGAAVAVLLAVLTYHEDWLEALLMLLLCLLLLRLTIAVIELLTIRLAPLSSVTAFVVHWLTSHSLPEDILRLLDRLTKTVMLSGIYLAVIGAVWATSQDAFGRLLEDGNVELLTELENQAAEEDEEGGDDEEKLDADGHGEKAL